MLRQRGRYTKFHQNPLHPNEKCSFKALYLQQIGTNFLFGPNDKNTFYVIFFCFYTRLLPPDFQTRHANHVSISRTLICDHFPPHSALCSLKSCNADLKTIAIHSAAHDPTACEVGRKSVVRKVCCVSQFVSKSILYENYELFFYPHPQFWISHTQCPQIYFCT